MAGRSILSFLVLGAAASALPAAPPPQRVDVGSAAPPFALLGGQPEAMGGERPSVIVFLDFSEDAAQAGDPRSSAAEAGALRSVSSWQGGGGLRAVAVDAAPTVLGKTASVDDLVARAREWGIEAVPIVQDHRKAGLARRYGVTGTPCVFLVDGAGIVRARWDREVDAAEIASRLASVGRTPSPRGASVR
jgi:hypothetical protein